RLHELPAPRRRRADRHRALDLGRARLPGRRARARVLSRRRPVRVRLDHGRGGARGVPGADPPGRHHACARNGSRRGPRHAPGEDAPRVEGDRRRALGPRRQGRPRRGEGARAGGQVSRLATTFDELRARGERALVAYFTAGEPSLARTAADAGADGVIVADLPLEEAGPFSAEAEAAGLDLVHLVAPTSTPGRVRLIARRSRGFIYVVSLTGVTGERRELPRDLEAQI